METDYDYLQIPPEIPWLSWLQEPKAALRDAVAAMDLEHSAAEAQISWRCSICDRWCGTRGVRSFTMLPEDVEGVWDTIDFGLTGCSSGDYCGRFEDCALVMLARARKLPQALNISIYRWTLNGNASKQNRSQLFLFLQRYLINFTQLWLDLEILLWKIMGLLLASCSQNIQHHQTWSRPITPCAALIDVSNYFFVCSQEALPRDSLIFVQK